MKPKPIHWLPSLWAERTKCGKRRLGMNPYRWTYARGNVTCDKCLAAMAKPLLEGRK